MKRNIEDMLHGNGNLIAAARRKGLSLSGPDRRIIDRVRSRAIEAGFGWTFINAMEMEGERGAKGYKAFPIDAIFRGLQNVDLLGLSIRLYNVEGDHPLNHSTVGVSTLIHNRIRPLDISLAQIGWECVKEQFVLSAWTLLSRWEVIKSKCAVRP